MAIPIPPALAAQPYPPNLQPPFLDPDDVQLAQTLAKEIVQGKQQAVADTDETVKFGGEGKPMEVQSQEEKEKVSGPEDGRPQKRRVAIANGFDSRTHRFFFVFRRATKRR